MHAEAQGLNEACSQADLFRCLLGRDFRLAHWHFDVRAVPMTGVTGCCTGRIGDAMSVPGAGLWAELQVHGENADARGFLDGEFHWGQPLPS